jgi:Zn-dependent peptidase ImmA (M78 family)
MARGILIYEIEPPIIGINEKDGYAAKTFTIIHELVYLLKHESTCCSDLFDSFSEN